MKIINKKDNLTEFKNVDIGDVFHYCNELFMKITGSSIEYTPYDAVCLDSGVCKYIDENTKVKTANVYIECDKE